MVSKPTKPRLGFLFLLVVVISGLGGAESSCSRGCDQALASYYVWEGTNLTFIAEIFSTQINTIASLNGIANPDNLLVGTRLNVPFACDCINREFLGHEFTYGVRSGNTYDRIANLYYSNLTTPSWLQRFNSYLPERIPDVNAFLNVTVNCSCGDESVSRDYGLFVTYPLRPGETLSSVAASASLPAELIQRYNPNSNFSSGNGLVYIPARGYEG